MQQMTSNPLDNCIPHGLEDREDMENVLSLADAHVRSVYLPIHCLPRVELQTRFFYSQHIPPTQNYLIEFGESPKC